MRTSNPLHAIPAAIGVTALAAAASLAFSAAPAQADGCQALFPEQPLRPTLSAGLPDCRAYEQVNPVSKGGGNLVPIAVSDDGQTVAYGAFSAFTGSSGGSREVFYFAHR